MKRLLTWSLVLAAPLLFALAVPAATGKMPAPRVKRTDDPIYAAAMDGPRFAYNIAGGVGHGNKILVWNVLTGRRTLVSGMDTRKATPSGGGAIDGLAIAGTRVAWLAYSNGNYEYDETLFTSSTAAPRERARARAVRGASDCPAGRCVGGSWIDGLVGSDSVLALSRWSTQHDGSILPGGGLDLIAAGGLRRIVSGPDGIVAKAADAGRIAVLRSSGTIGESLIYKPADVVIYTAGGKLLKKLKPAGIDENGISRMAEIALQGNSLAVLTPRPRLELYNWRNGALLHSWRVPRGARHLDLYGQVATYIVVGPGRTSLTLHVVELRTGKDVVLAREKSPPATFGFVNVQIEAPGLVYAVNEYTNKLGGYGRLVFVPMARVFAAVSKGVR
jgi:hypothetical protein